MRTKRARRIRRTVTGANENAPEVHMFGLGSQEIMLILLLVVVIFGAGKLPQIGEGMGKAIRNFKRAANDTASNDVIDITPKSGEAKKVTADDESKKA